MTWRAIAIALASWFLLSLFLGMATGYCLRSK